MPRSAACEGGVLMFQHDTDGSPPATKAIVADHPSDFFLFAKITPTRRFTISAARARTGYPSSGIQLLLSAPQRNQLL
jgi:hypothetical protein